MIQWNICKNCHVPLMKNWWKHRAEIVVENEQIKILRDFQIQTGNISAHNTPCITVVGIKMKVDYVPFCREGDTYFFFKGHGRGNMGWRQMSDHQAAADLVTPVKSSLMPI